MFFYLDFGQTLERVHRHRIILIEVKLLESYAPPACGRQPIALAFCPFAIDFAILSHPSTSICDFTKGSCNGGPIRSTECSRVHCLSTCRGCQAQIGSHPGHAGDEADDIHSTAHVVSAIAHALLATLVNGTIQIHDAFHQIGGGLNGVNHTLRADEGIILRCLLDFLVEQLLAQDGPTAIL